MTELLDAPLARVTSTCAQMGWIKVNLDGSFKNVNGVCYSAGAIVFMDERGLTVADDSRIFCSIENEEAELETLKFALFEALRHVFKKIVTEMDNFFIVKKIQVGTDYPVAHFDKYW